MEAPLRDGDVTFWEVMDDRPSRTVARRRAEVVRLRHKPSRPVDLDDAFALLAEELDRASEGVSSTRRLTNHRAYLGVLALGEEAIPLVIDHLRVTPSRPIWLRVLGALTGLPPAVGQETIERAALTWFQLGQRLRHLSR